MQSLTRQLLDKTNLDATQITVAAAQLVDPAVESVLKADFLRALAKKGETPAEIAAFVKRRPRTTCTGAVARSASSSEVRPATPGTHPIANAIAIAASADAISASRVSAAASDTAAASPADAPPGASSAPRGVAR